jgi:prevent-host-death family protein
MSEYSVTEARAEFPSLLDLASKKPVHIVRHGEPVAVLISPAFFEEALAAMEELEDIEAYDEAMASKESTFPWEQVKRELGLA